QRATSAADAAAELAAALAAFRVAMAGPLATGARRGLPNRAMAVWLEPATGVVVSHLTPLMRVVDPGTLAARADAIGELIGRYEAGLEHRLGVVDPLLGLAGGVQRAARLATGRSPTGGAADSRAGVFAAVDVTVAPDELAARLVALGEPRRAAQEIGNPRPAYGATWDMHLHHGDYSDPRYTRLADLLGWLRDAGHTGRVLLSPIPQRGRGLATAGGGFYYANTGELRQGITFGNAMLTMRGKFPDVRLFDAIRDLPDDLRWRALPGISGARIDIPGAQGYLTAMLLLNPDLGYVVAETTLAKEAVTRLLGPQAAHVLAPEYMRYVRRLNTALRRITDEVRDPDGAITLDDVRLFSPALARLVAGTGPRDYVAALTAAAEPVREVLEALGRTAEADALRMRDARGDLTPTAVVPDPYSPHVRELLAAAETTGQVVILHNDAGEAIVEADGRYVAATPDERHLRPLVALLRQYPRAQVSLSHLGVGKWTELTVEHLGVLREVLTQEVHRLETGGPASGDGREAFPRLVFDVSWNDLAQHIERSDAVRREVIALIRDFPQHFVYGSDSVKSPSLPNYLRHYYDMAPILADVATDAAGAEAVRRLLHGNAEAMVAEAARRGQAFAFAELTAPDGFYAQLVAAGTLTPARRAVVDRWIAAQAAAGVTAPAGHRPVGPTPDWTPGTSADLAAYLDRHEQVSNAIAWHNAVDPAVVAGRDTPTLRTTNRRIQRADRAADRADAALRDAEAARLAALPEGPTAAPTRGQRRRGLPASPRGPPFRGLAATGGAPFTLEALISAREADAMFAGGPMDAAGRRAEQDTALRQVQAAQTRLENAETAVAATRDGFHRAAARARRGLGALLAGGAGAMTWALVAGPLATPGSLVGAAVAGTTVGAVLSAGAFVLRGLAQSPRTVRTQYVRVLHEAPIERGRLSRTIVERLAAELLGNLAAEGRMADGTAGARIVEDRAARIRAETDEFLRILDALVNLPLVPAYRDPATGRVLRPAETRADREALAVKEYSTWHDKVTRAAGATASSFIGLRPHSGTVGRALQTLVAGTFAVNLTYHVLAAAGGAAAIVTGGVAPDAAGVAALAGVVTNAVFAGTDVVLGWPAFRTAAAGRAGWDDTNDPRLRRWQNLAGSGLVVGGAALTLQLAAQGNLPVALAAAGFTGAATLLARHGRAIEDWRGRAAAPRRGATAALATQTGLVGLGLASLPHPAFVAVGAAVASAVPALYVVRRIGKALTGRLHPGGGDGPLALPGTVPFPAELVGTALRRLVGRDVPADQQLLPYDARGPPVRTVAAADLVAELRGLGLEDAVARDTVGRTVAYTVRGVVVVTAERAAEIAARLGEPGVAAWWRDVLAHEIGHHVTGWAHGDHDADAAALAGRHRELFGAGPVLVERASLVVPPTGHLVRLAGVPTTTAQSVVTGQVIREGVTTALVPLPRLAALAGPETVLLSGLGCQGLCAIDGFGARIRALGGPDDVVAFVHDDGWIYVDTRTFAALRAGALDTTAWRGLVGEVRTALAGTPLRPAGTLAPLADVVRGGPVGRRPARPLDLEAYPVRFHDGGVRPAGTPRDLLATMTGPGLPRGFEVEGWADLPAEVRSGLTAAATLLSRVGLLDTVLERRPGDAVPVAVLSEAAFAARAATALAGSATDVAAYAHLGGGLVLRQSWYRLDGPDLRARNARLVDAAGVLLHELTHVVDDPVHAGRATERSAHLAEHHFLRAMHGVLDLGALRGVTGPDVARRRAVAAAWTDVLRAWSPLFPAPRNYPLPRGYDDLVAGHDGPVALPGRHAYPVAAVAGALARVGAQAVPLDPAVLPYAPRGPPVRVVPGAVLRGALRDGGLPRRAAADAVARTLAFTAGGVVYVPAERAATIAARHDEPAVAAWWRDLLAHEVEHHLTGRGTGDDADAAGLAQRYRQLTAPRWRAHAARVLAGAALAGVLGPLGALVTAGVAVAEPPAVSVSAAVTVRAGDTLGGLARALGVDATALAAANPGRFPDAAARDRIRAGETLRAPPGWDGTWRVQRGDSLGAIAARLGTTPAQLAVANPGRFAGRDLDRLRAGETLRVVPGPPPAPGAPPAPTTTAPPGPPAPQAPGPGAPRPAEPAPSGTPAAPATPDTPGGRQVGEPGGPSPPLVAGLGGVGLVLAHVVVRSLVRLNYARDRGASLRAAALTTGAVAVITAGELALRAALGAGAATGWGAVVLGLPPAIATLAWGSLVAAKPARFLGAWLTGSAAVYLFPAAHAAASWGEVGALFAGGLASVLTANVAFEFVLTVIARRRQHTASTPLASRATARLPGVAGAPVRTYPGEEPQGRWSQARADLARLPRPWGSWEPGPRGALRWVWTIAARPGYWGLVSWTGVFALTTAFPPLGPLPGIVAPAALLTGLLGHKVYRWTIRTTASPVLARLAAALPAGGRRPVAALAAQTGDRAWPLRESVRRARGDEFVLEGDTVRRAPARLVALEPPRSRRDRLARLGAVVPTGRNLRAGYDAVLGALDEQRVALTKTGLRTLRLRLLESVLPRLLVGAPRHLPVLRAVDPLLAAGPRDVAALAAATGFAPPAVRAAVTSPWSGLVVDGNAVRRPAAADGTLGAQVPPGGAVGPRLPAAGGHELG
ncbi:LysM peptidoglycan-binding domain-containing protein, partial [Actinomycetospora chlora]|uniref:LysM peptidoglycan-binding domain-containing protein n=1 Tax=Actinomycetospora chlora TaxID=663608 RepID=UPI0031EE8184